MRTIERSGAMEIDGSQERDGGWVILGLLVLGLDAPVSAPIAVVDEGKL